MESGLNQEVETSSGGFGSWYLYPCIRTMVDGCDLGWGSSKDLWLPCVEMGVEMDDRDGSVSLVHGAQKRQSYSVVTSEGQDTRQCLSMLGDASHVCVSSRLTHQDTVVAFFDLLQSPLVVVTCHRNITTIDDSGPSIEGVSLECRQY
jgi:hypothetical protein